MPPSDEVVRAIRVEREACAILADLRAAYYDDNIGPDPWYAGAVAASREIAEKIRARGDDVGVARG